MKILKLFCILLLSNFVNLFSSEQHNSLKVYYVSKIANWSNNNKSSFSISEKSYFTELLGKNSVTWPKDFTFEKFQDPMKTINEIKLDIWNDLEKKRITNEEMDELFSLIEQAVSQDSWYIA